MDKKLAKIAENTLFILSKKDWQEITIEEVYLKSKLKKKNFKSLYNKQDLLINIIKFFDFNLNSLSSSVEKSSSKDMIFEIMMMRFDILQKYRSSIVNLFNFIKKKPQEIVCLLPAFIESVSLMANLANINTTGLKGNLKIKGLLLIYFSTFLVWSKDKSKTLDKTMISLDSNLNRAGKIVNIL
tara:strand:+ start:302 stop:853 length:552 start_codon:yes stop_codon:yes gene_type:complete